MINKMETVRSINGFVKVSNGIAFFFQTISNRTIKTTKKIEMSQQKAFPDRISFEAISMGFSCRRILNHVTIKWYWFKIASMVTKIYHNTNKRCAKQLCSNILLVVTHTSVPSVSIVQQTYFQAYTIFTIPTWVLMIFTAILRYHFLFHTLPFA